MDDASAKGIAEIQAGQLALHNQVVAHEQTIDAFKKESAEGKATDPKAFVDQTLPKLEAHLKAAKAPANAPGGDAATQ